MASKPNVKENTGYTQVASYRPHVGGPYFDPRSVVVRFIVEEVTLGQVSNPILQCSAVSIIPPTLHTQQLTYHRYYIILATDNIVKQYILQS